MSIENLTITLITKLENHSYGSVYLTESLHLSSYWYECKAHLKKIDIIYFTFFKVTFQANKPFKFFFLHIYFM